MRSAVALESRRAQALASLMIMSATVSVLIICANGSAFSSQGGTASCFFLAGRSVGEGFGWFFGKGEAWALCIHTSSFPLTSISFSSLNSRGQLLVSHLHPCSLGLAFASGACWILLILAGPRRDLKIQGQTFHIPHHRINIPPYYI